MIKSPADLLALAEAGDSNAAAELWRAIDAGKVDDATTAAWARSVALQVVAKVLNPEIPANRRAENARAAIGLEGRLDANPELKDLAVRIAADVPANQLATYADLVVDVRGKDQRQVRRQITYYRKTHSGGGK